MLTRMYVTGVPDHPHATPTAHWPEMSSRGSGSVKPRRRAPHTAWLKGLLRLSSLNT